MIQTSRYNKFNYKSKIWIVTGVCMCVCVYPFLPCLSLLHISFTLSSPPPFPLLSPPSEKQVTILPLSPPPPRKQVIPPDSRESNGLGNISMSGKGISHWEQGCMWWNEVCGEWGIRRLVLKNENIEIKKKFGAMNLRWILNLKIQKYKESTGNVTNSQ